MTTSRDPLFDAIREHVADDIENAYATIGVDLQAAGRSWRALCPLHDERTPSFHVFADGGWHCFGCGVGGDVVNLHTRMAGRHGEPGAQIAAARELAALFGLAISPGGTPRPRAERPPPAPGKSYPPADEVAAAWNAALPVCDVPEAGAWIRSRGLDLRWVADLDWVRALRPGATLPSWARGPRGPWVQSGHLIITQGYDHTGRVASLHARCVAVGGPPDGMPKGLWPAGHRSAGLVMADGAGRDLLQRHYLPDTVGTVVLTEGLPDWLTIAARPHAVRVYGAPPLWVWGVGAGSATADLANRVPVGASVVVATHADRAGERYAAAWYHLLPGRSLRRVTLSRNGENP